MDEAFRAMLVSISNKLNDTELKTLKFYVNIKPKLSEKMLHPIDLFRTLEERQDLKQDDLRYFRKMIADTLVTRKDLLKIIDDYVKNLGDRVYTENSDFLGGTPHQHYSGLQKEKDFLAKNYGKGWKFFMRRLNLPDGEIEHIEAKNKDNQRETINECIQFWLNEQQDNASREKLIWALKLEERNDLIRKLNDIK